MVWGKVRTMNTTDRAVNTDPRISIPLEVLLSPSAHIKTTSIHKYTTRLLLVTMAEALPLCYHGSIGRKECEDLMGKKNKDGSYLIRDSETVQGAMCLCVYKKHVVYTYRLLKTVTGQYMLMASGGEQELHFKSLDDLILHYKRKNQGLAIHLRHSVKRKTALLIKSTAQMPNQRPDPRPEDTSDQRRPSAPGLQSPRRAEERRESHAAADYNHPRPVQPTEHEEVDYENVPDYVDVEPS
uniref:SH2 domain-containing protein n=1 Tax=Neogobius melanostomus TaxID=47308 RepID=A0A8C6WKW7_9GOBI